MTEKLTVEGIEAETHDLIKQAALKDGASISAWISSRLRETAERALSLTTATDVSAEDEADRLLIDFYVSPAYDPNAARPADIVKAAIAFALQSQAAKTRKVEAERDAIFAEAIEWRDKCDAAEARLAQMRAAAEPFALAVKVGVPDDQLIDTVAWTAGQHRALCRALTDVQDKGEAS